MTTWEGLTCQGEEFSSWVSADDEELEGIGSDVDGGEEVVAWNGGDDGGWDRGHGG